jgi:protease secretion system membrane fusion protein
MNIKTSQGETVDVRMPTPALAGKGAEAIEAERLTDTRTPIRLGFWSLIVGFGAFMAWAIWAPLDEGVPAPATVAVESRRTTIQHIQGGVVRERLVKDGDIVKAGDVLVELDPATTRASFQSIRQNYLSQRAMEGRLLAEIAGASSIQFHPDLLKPDDGMAQQFMTVQKQLFEARRASHIAEMAAMREAITNNELQMAGLRQMVQARRAQQGLQTQQLAGVKALAEEGFAPRNQALQLEQSQADLRSSLADLDSNILRLQSTVAEAKLRIAQRQQEYAREASGQLAELRSEVQANAEKLNAITVELDRMQIKTPVAGQVIGLAVGGPGSVVAAGQHLMDILPADATLKLDVRVPPQVIDRVKVGSEVEVRFSAFAATPHLVVLGKMTSLSGDVVTETVGNNTNTFYAARVELTPEGLKALGPNVVLPGMTADILIKSGERSLMTYLLHPLLKRIAASMTEQ